MDTRTSPYRLRIERVRDAMQRHGLAALLVPSSDPHLSEYLPPRWQGRQWLSGFTGSVAMLVVTLDAAALFADSRYWVQAEAELAGSGIELERIPTSASARHVDWLLAQVSRDGVVAVDGAVLAVAAAQALCARLDSAGLTVRTDLDLLDEVWTERPALAGAPVYEHAAPHATQSRSGKLEAVRVEMARQGASHHFISTLDDIAWLLNLRGSDVSYNPVFLAHLLVGERGATLFLGKDKVSTALQQSLLADGVTLASYERAGEALAELPTDAVLLVDPRRVTLGLRENATVEVVEAINPSTLLKSRKSADEAMHIREAMAHDGAALCEFYAWFEAALARAESPVTELHVDEQLQVARARRPGFVGPSFATIAAFNANGAMPHYRATPVSHATIEGDGLLLIDSGAHYLGGTTDITRIWPIGVPSTAQRRDCTLVLKGLIALSRTRYPVGTPSPMLDAIARAPLWAEGLDYGHGTGHGVGFFLNVHEGPQSISKATPEPTMAMLPGMVTSIEPGVYRPGRWGVRIENLVLNVESERTDAFGDFLAFETLTMCPIDTKSLERDLLRADEIEWLNAYHATVRARLSPLLSGPALAWLLVRTAPF